MGACGDADGAARLGSARPRRVASPLLQRNVETQSDGGAAPDVRVRTRLYVVHRSNVRSRSIPLRVVERVNRESPSSEKTRRLNRSEEDEQISRRKIGDRPDRAISRGARRSCDRDPKWPLFTGSLSGGFPASSSGEAGQSSARGTRGATVGAPSAFYLYRFRSAGQDALGTAPLGGS